MTRDLLNKVHYFRVAYEFIVTHETGIKLPPMWTPTNSVSKAAAIEVLFPRKVESLGYVAEKLPPPQVTLGELYLLSKITPRALITQFKVQMQGFHS